jgi:hypothetical protein
MAEAIKAGVPESISPGATYRVQLLKAIPFAGGKLLPSKAHEMTGAVLSELLAGDHKDSIYGAEPA